MKRVGEETTHLLDVSARRAVGKLDLKAKTSLDDADLSGGDHQVAKLGLDVESSLLRHDKEISTARTRQLPRSEPRKRARKTHSLLMNARLSMLVLAMYM